MPYIDRDENENIVGIFSIQQRKGQEYTDDDVSLYKTPEQIKVSGLLETESADILARKLEEVINFIDTDKPLSTSSKEWKDNRILMRGE